MSTQADLSPIEPATHDPRATRRPDRRVQRSRALLRDALFALIREKGFDHLTIQDITERANLSRATFYLHYRDKDELLATSLQEIYATMAHDVPTPSLDEIRRSPEPETVAYTGDLQHVVEYADLYRIMLSERGVWPFWSKILDYLGAELKPELEALAAANGRPSAVPIDLIASYCAGASLGTLRWWLLESPDTTPEELARLAYRLEAHGLWWSLNIDSPRPPLDPNPPGQFTVRKLALDGTETFSYGGRLIQRGAAALTLEARFQRHDRLDLGYTVFERGDRMLEHFFADRWYNVFECHAVGTDALRGWYCNIARPALIDADTVSQVDLALDVWVRPDGSSLVLDEDEFAALGLAEAEQAQARAAVAEIQRLAARRAWPFTAL